MAFHLPSTDWLSVDAGNPLCNYIVYRLGLINRHYSELD